tara:strand:- start:1627 stop:2058 length:432 start_codon:yes stop_codon:yes gene_type:complete
MEAFKKLQNICAALIIIAFFLPWVSFGGFFSFSGYDIPGAAKMAGEFGAAMSGGSASSGVNVLYAVYVVPLLAAGILLMEYLGKNSKVLCVASGTFNIIGLIVVVIKIEGQIGFLSIGIWITAIASIVMMLSSMGVIKNNLQS